MPHGSPQDHYPSNHHDTRGRGLMKHLRDSSGHDCCNNRTCHGTIPTRYLSYQKFLTHWEPLCIQAAYHSLTCPLSGKEYHSSTMQLH